MGADYAQVVGLFSESTGSAPLLDRVVFRL